MTDATLTTVDLTQGVPGPDTTELTVRQLQAIDAFHRVRVAAEQAAASRAGSRETRLDAARRLDVVRRQHAAIVQVTGAALRGTTEACAGTGPRVVVAHRNDWFGRTIARALDEGGFRLLARLDNGADAVGTALADQPELLILEDLLPMMTGEQVVAEVHHYAPATVVAVHVSDPGAVPGLLRAGAAYVYTRQAAPGDVASDLCRRFGGRPLVVV